MRSSQWLFEAEANAKVKKQLDLLSDADIEQVLNLIRLNEQGKKMSYQSYLKSTQKPLEVGISTKTPQKSKPSVEKVKSQRKNTSSKTNKQDIESVIKNLSKKDKELLVATLQKEKTKRVVKRKNSGKGQTSQPAQTTKKSSGMLGKVILGLILGIGGAAYFSSDEPPQTASAAQSEPKQDDATKKFMQTGEMAPYTIKRYIKQTAYDEDSLKFRNWEMHAFFVDPSKDEAHLLITGEVNGKNRLGAYVGYKKFIVSIDPDSGEIQKYYTQDDPKYYEAMAMIKGVPGWKSKTVSTPITGPS